MWQHVNIHSLIFQVTTFPDIPLIHAYLHVYHLFWIMVSIMTLWYIIYVALIFRCSRHVLDLEHLLHFSVGHMEHLQEEKVLFYKYGTTWHEELKLMFRYFHFPIESNDKAWTRIHSFGRVSNEFALKPIPNSYAIKKIWRSWQFKNVWVYWHIAIIN